MRSVVTAAACVLLGAAGAHAFLGDRDRAMEFFTHALTLNPWDRYYNLIRPDLKPLWEDERFTRLITTGK